MVDKMVVTMVENWAVQLEVGAMVAQLVDYWADKMVATLAKFWAEHLAEELDEMDY